MPLQGPVRGIAPGTSARFQGSPLDLSGNFVTDLPSDLIMTWISSDSINAPITGPVTGEFVTISVPTTAVIGSTFTLSVSATLADGSIPSGSTPIAILGSQIIASFIITNA